MSVVVLTLQQRLDAAREAYHKLQTGSLREVVDHNGTRIQYSRTDVEKLKAYIQELEGDLADGIAPPRRRRAIINWF